MRELSKSPWFGVLIGIVISLVGLLIVSAIAGSGPDRRERVIAIIDQDVSAAQRAAASRQPKDDRLRIYMMPPAQTGSPGSSSYPTPPGSATPSAPTPAEPTRNSVADDTIGLRVIEVSARLAEMTTAGPKQSWKLTVRNDNAAPRRFGALIRFLDSQGRTTHKCRLRSLAIGPRVTATYEGSVVIDQSLPPTPAQVEADLLPSQR